ncbi:hypothetical protein V496_04257 [Pseudogymnoascus sp. VKM F-4515 (FW-2607)]|nr:hypothetical protein V496_04257 [Pseudogymnoascus sp. VKM F-4515 (FW-2607)]
MPIFSDDELLELSLLRAKEVDELVEHDLLDASRRFDEDLLDILVFSYPELTISLHTGPTYPAEQLRVEFENISLPRLVVDGLRNTVREIVVRDADTNNYEGWSGRSDIDDFGMFEFEMTAFHVARVASEHLEGYRDSIKESQEESARVEDLPPKYKNDIVLREGVDLSSITVDRKASDVLGKLPDEICSLIPPYFRILHVESVLRNDLYSKFAACQNEIRNELMALPRNELQACITKNQSIRRGQAEELVEHIVAPKLTFHGTSNRFVPSIVQHGFLAPGAINPTTGKALPVRCGSTYGRGIYSSPLASYSLSYSGSEAEPTAPDGFWGLKLIVCATLMGRSAHLSREDQWSKHSVPYPGAHSHVGNEFEYVVFNSAQILPCYVVHLDWGAHNTRFFEDIPNDKANFVAKTHPKLLNEPMAPGDKQRAKEALVAKASKYFPYGYGPATGTSFVVEDVGEVDEDEEDYGEYQGDRIDQTHEESNFWKWNDEFVENDELKEMRMDEYTRLRRGK